MELIPIIIPIVSFLLPKLLHSANIGNKPELEREVTALCNTNNLEKRVINWSFTRCRADKKLCFMIKLS